MYVPGRPQQGRARLGSSIEYDTARCWKPPQHIGKLARTDSQNFRDSEGNRGFLSTRSEVDKNNIAIHSQQSFAFLRRYPLHLTLRG